MSAARRFVHALASFLAMPIAVAACGGSDVAGAQETSATTGEMITGCPSEIGHASGAACKSGLSCSFPITCDTINQQARCTCVDGNFMCADSMGFMPSGSAPRCEKNPAPDMDACPQTMDEAAAMPCKEVGFLCVYRGMSCPQRVVPFSNYCQCVNVDGGGQAMQCNVPSCGPGDVD